MRSAVRANGEPEGDGGGVSEGVSGGGLGAGNGDWGVAGPGHRRPGVLVGKKKADALRAAFGENAPEVGLGDRHTDFPFMTLCKVCMTMTRWSIF